MQQRRIHALLFLSLLFNVGVIGTVGYSSLGESGHGGVGARAVQLADYLKLSPAQLPAWEEKEAAFMRELMSAWGEIRAHRERMIREVFSAEPNLSIIESERLAIARLQEQQQHAVIRQLMEERYMLNPDQIRKLESLLIRENPLGSMEEILVHELHSN